MTYDEIIDAFEFCITDGDCKQCPVESECSTNLLYLDKQVLTSYRELLKEHRHLKSQLDVLSTMVGKSNEKNGTGGQTMNYRDRLVELLCNLPEQKCITLGGRQIGKVYQTAGTIADHLLANGVIVPPCKAGDIVYYPYEYGNKVLEKTVIKILIEKEDRWLDVGVSFLPFENIGKTVFLTREEAEKKLEELRGNVAKG